MPYRPTTQASASLALFRHRLLATRDGAVLACQPHVSIASQLRAQLRSGRVSGELPACDACGCAASG
jgi:hypothetical protein